MCYHVSTPTIKELRDYIKQEADVAMEEYQAYYHTAGFSHKALPTMLSKEQNKIQPVTWGFTPEKMTEDKAQDYFKSAYSLNAKSETIFSVYLYKAAAKTNRCLIFVDGFYEWKHEGEGKSAIKIPHYIQMPDHKPFALGGLYSERGGNKTSIILTTAANELMTSIHNTKKRMPFIVPETLWGDWLNTETPEEQVKQMTVPYPEGFLEAHEISNNITKRGFDTNVREIQLPVAGDQQPTQQGLF